jgi:6-phosphogluconolactonase (cycloisomerase 2 family)
MRSFFVYLSLVFSLSFLVACGGSSNSNNGNNSNNNSPAPPPSGTNGSDSGSSGSGSGSGGSGSSGSGGASNSPVSYVYTASTSTIWGYGVSSNSSLTAVSGSPYSASTAQGANIVTNGANLYAIAEDNIANLDIFSINKSSGSLTLANSTSATVGDPNRADPVHGDPAGGLALDHTGASLYVSVGVTDLNGGINAFAVGSGSSAQQFQFLSTGAVAFPALVFSPNNQNAYSNTCFFRSEGVSAYTRASDGTLKNLSIGPVTEPTVTGAAFCPGALAVSAKGYLAVVWLREFMCCGSSENHVYVMTYKINGDGTLTAISGSQQQTASITSQNSANNVAANFDPSGSVLAMAGNGGIQTYSLNGNGMLAPAGSAQNAGVRFQNVAWDNSNHVFATDSSELYVFNSSSGMLSAASGSPYPGGQALTVLPLQ